MNGDAASAEPDFKAIHVARQWRYSSPFTACRFDPLGRYVFAAARDQTIQRWDLEKDTQTSFAGHESWLRAIGFSPDGSVMYSAGYDGHLFFWDATAKEPTPNRRIDNAHDGWIRWLSVSPNGEIIATGGNDNLVKLWSSENGQCLRTIEKHQSHVYSTLFHPNGDVLLSGDLTGVINQWNVTSAELVRTLDAKDLHSYNGGQRAHYGGVRSMSLSPDGKTLACSGFT